MQATHFTAIAQWLAANAPRIAAHSLNPPASNEELDKLAQAIPFTLPADFTALYQWHNGLDCEENHGNLFFGMSFYTIDEIIQELAFNKEATNTHPSIPLQQADKGIDASHLYNTGWIPFGSDGSRCRLILDLAPDKDGQYGQIIFVDGEYNIALLIALSTADLIKQFASDLQAGLYALSEEAMEDDNHFLEADNTIDIGNWYHIDKWKHYDR